MRPKQTREVMIARREIDNALRALAEASRKLVTAAEVLDKTEQPESGDD